MKLFTGYRIDLASAKTIAGALAAVVVALLARLTGWEFSPEVRDAVGILVAALVAGLLASDATGLAIRNAEETKES